MLRVLLVDDSSFMRKELSSILEEDPAISVIATAVDGIEAVEKSSLLNPDVIVMDIEMPRMDGIQAVAKIRSSQNIPIVLLSGVNKMGAGRVLDGLHAGAADFIPKELESPVCHQKFGKKLRSRLLSLVDTNVKSEQSIRSSQISVAKTADSLARLKKSDYEIVAIAASTGGPVAIENVLEKLPTRYPFPVVIVQHMPGTFTEAFAERLNSICEITIEHAHDGQTLSAGHVYIAPGGKQLTVTRRGGRGEINIFKAQDQQYNPCADITFKSIAEQYRSRALGIVLTGMGNDGLQGAQELKSKGATLWAQDKASSVIYGMPMAIARNNLADKILSLDAIGTELAAA